jgi:hypothetical protein
MPLEELKTVVITHPVVVDGEHKKPGDVVTGPKGDMTYLVGIKRATDEEDAIKAATKKKPEDPKK